jgi:hypothetical protein
VHASPKYPETPVVPCSTRRTRPLASRASVWTISPLGKDLAIHRLAQHAFRTFPYSFLFVLDLLLSISLSPFYLSPLTIERHRTSLTLVYHGPAVAHLEWFGKKFLHLDPAHFAIVAARACRRQDHLRVRLSSFPPLTHLVRRVLVLTISDSPI